MKTRSFEFTFAGLMLALSLVFAYAWLQVGAKASESTQDGSDARAALRDSRDTRYYFPSSFAGFTADVTINDNGQIARAVINYDLGGGADLQFKAGDVKESRAWVLEAVLNLIRHRRSSDFESREGRYIARFADEDKSPMGRRILVKDSMQTSYRVLDNHVTEVDRTIEDERFVISVLEETPVGQGRFLPRHFVLNYFDAATGALKHSDYFTDEYRQIDGVWFPMSERIVKAEAGRLTTRIIAFQNIRLRFSQTATSEAKQ